MIRKTHLFLLVLIIFSSCRNEEVKDNGKALEKKVTTETENDTEIVKSTFPLENIYGIWSENLNNPHADFEITKRSFYIVDYDGNGDMEYELYDNKIKVYYPDSEQEGIIKKAENDSLIIYWSSGQYATYVRWKQ